MLLKHPQIITVVATMIIRFTCMFVTDLFLHRSLWFVYGGSRANIDNGLHKRPRRRAITNKTTNKKTRRYFRAILILQKREQFVVAFNN